MDSKIRVVVFANIVALTVLNECLMVKVLKAYSGLKNRCNVWQFWSGCNVALGRVRMMLSVAGVK